MAQLRQDYQRFKDNDTEIVVIGPEGKEAFHKHWEKTDLKFIGLPDPTHRILRLYGQEVKWLKLGRMPAQMLIDKSGTLLYVHYSRSMNDIPSNDEIMNLISQ